MNPAISVIHPAARPGQLAKAVTAWYRACAGAAAGLQYVVCHHAEQTAEFAGAAPPQSLQERFTGLLCVVNSGPNHPTRNGRSSFVDNVNCAARAATGDVLVLATDDLEPPEGWDSLVLGSIASCANVPRRTLRDGRVQPEVVLKCSNGDARSDARDLILHPIMTRARYERQGWIFPSDYSGMYSDNELTIRARIDGVVVEAPHVTFLHRHPDYGTATMDQIYAWQNSRDEFARGMETFKARAALGFPHADEARGPQPVTLYFGKPA